MMVKELEQVVVRFSGDCFTNVESIEKDKTIGDLTIHRIQGHHGFGQIGEMMGPVSGYVLTASGFPTVYIMSDCKWEECIRQTIEQFSPDYMTRARRACQLPHQGGQQALYTRDNPQARRAARPLRLVGITAI